MRFLLAAAVVFAFVFQTSESRADDPPVLQFFSGVDLGFGEWSFYGAVSDENAAGCTVYFGDLLDGESTTVDQYGYFSFTATFDPGTFGYVSALAKDSAQQDSNEKEVYVDER